MRGVYRVDEIRAAEDALMARLPEGALMARAATGLAVECAALLGRVYGRASRCSSGPATTAATRSTPAPRSPGVARRSGPCCSIPTGRTRPGWPRCCARVDGSSPPTPSRLAGADLVIDGIVGIGGHGGLRAAAAALAAAAREHLTVAVDIAVRA